MTEKGIIESVTDKKIILRLTGAGNEACGNCAIKGVCSQNSAGERFIELDRNKAGGQSFAAGDHVKLVMSEGLGIAVSAALFILPLILLILSYFIMRSFLTEAMAILASMGITAIGFMAIAFFLNARMKTLHVKRL